MIRVPSWLVVRFACIRLLLAVGLLSVVGCGFGKNTGKVSGTVQFRNRPVTQGNVNFLMKEKGIGATGSIDSSGKYVLDTPLEEGTYVVYLTPPVVEPTRPGTVAPKVAQEIPPRYRDPNTSQLSFTVKKGTNEYPITLMD